MKIEDIKQILIIGSGTMGQMIGFHYAACGYAVTFYDVSRELLDQIPEKAGKQAAAYVQANRLTREAADAALARIRSTDDPSDAGRDADLVSESVPEDPELKAQVFARFNEVCPARTIFTTNTSSLAPSEFAGQTGRPEKFAAFHFHDLRFNRVVDIMPHPGTDEKTLDLIEALAIKAELLPIRLKKESPGYVFNHMLMHWLHSAQSLAANGVAEVEDVDRAWMGAMLTHVGPFGIMDSIGIDTVWKITDYWGKKHQDPQEMANANFLKTYVDKGLLGAKTGQGFYTYPNPAFVQPGFVENKES